MPQSASPFALKIKGQLEARGVFIDGQGDPQPEFAKVLWQESEAKDNVGFNESGQEILARYEVELLGIEYHPEA